MFVHAFLKVMILHAIKREKYPYAVVKMLKKNPHPAIRSVSKSDIYNQINSLEKNGFIRKAAMKDGRKLYELTEKGNYTLKKAKEIRKKAFSDIMKLIKGKF